MMRHVVAAERQHVLVILPVALHELHLKTFFFEETLLDRGENRRLAGDADIADADFRRAAAAVFRIPLAADNEESAERRRRDQSGDGHNCASVGMRMIWRFHEQGLPESFGSSLGFSRPRP